MSELTNILSHSDCLSQEQINSYLANTLDKEQTHAVESHLIDCMFCSDAIEGLQTIPIEESSAHVADIKSGIEALLFDEDESAAPVYQTEKVAKPLSSTKGGKRISWRAAAGIFLLIFAGGLAVFSYVNNNTDWMKSTNNEVVKGDSKSKEIELNNNNVSGRELGSFAIDEEEIADLDEVKKASKKEIEKESSPTPSMDRKKIAKTTTTNRELARNESQVGSSSLPAAPRPAASKAIEETAAPKKINDRRDEAIAVAKAEETKLDLDKVSNADKYAGATNSYTQPLYEGKMKNVKDINSEPAVTVNKARKKALRKSKSAIEKESMEDIDIVQSKGLGKKSSYYQQKADYYSDGVYAFNQAKYKESVKLLKKALRNKNLKNREDALYYLALAYEKTNNMSKARKIYEQLSTSGPYKVRSQSRLQQIPTK